MKALVYIFAITVVLVSCNVTDKDDALPITADMIDPENPPVISFKSMTHDFGDVAMGQKLTHTFEFKNTGESPLLIHSVKPSCHCTVLQDWSKKPIKPGETGSITAQFEGKFAGKNNKYISVVANTSPNTTQLNLTANVVGGK